MENAAHDVGGMGVADELDARIREGNADDEGVFLQLVAVGTEKTPRHNADALGLLEELGDVVGRKQLCGVVGEEFDVVQPVGLGHLLFNAVELLLLHQAGEVQLHLEGAVFLIGTGHGVPCLLQDGAGGGIGCIAVQYFQYGLHSRFSLSFFAGGGVPRGCFK